MDVVEPWFALGNDEWWNHMVVDRRERRQH
jgi:hypothetical protein